MSDEDKKLEQVFSTILTNLNRGVKIELTDEEWMSIIARDRDGLPACCANISALRETLTGIAHNDGDVSFIYTTRLAQTITWCFPSHDVPSGAIQKVLDQLGYTNPDVEDHVRDKLEI